MNKRSRIVASWLILALTTARFPMHDSPTSSVIAPPPRVSSQALAATASFSGTGLLKPHQGFFAFHALRRVSYKLAATGVLAGMLNGLWLAPDPSPSWTEQEAATAAGMRQLIEPQSMFAADIAHLNRKTGQFELVVTDAHAMRTTPTNIGLGIVSMVLDVTQHRLTREEGARRLSVTVRHIAALQSRDGFLLQFYDLAHLRDGVPTPADPPETRYYSPLDNANLASSLLVALGMYDGTPLGESIKTVLVKQDYRIFFDPQAGLFRGGLYEKSGELMAFHYRTFNSEVQLLALLGAFQRFTDAQGHPKRVPLSVWNDMDRNPMFTRNGLFIYGNCYGSLFEQLFSDLFLNKVHFAQAFGPMYRSFTLDEAKEAATRGQPVFGFAPSYDDSGKYGIFGVPTHAAFPTKDGMSVVSAYPIILALRYAPELATANLNLLRKRYPKLYSPNAGYVESVNLANGQTAEIATTLGVALDLIGLNQRELSQNPVSDSFWRGMKFWAGASGVEKAQALIREEGVRLEHEKAVVLRSAAPTPRPDAWSFQRVLLWLRGWHPNVQAIKRAA